MTTLLLTDYQTSILSKMIKDAFGFGGLTLTYRQMANKYNCSLDTIQNIMRYCRINELIICIKANGKKWIKQFKQDARDMIAQPIKWLTRKGLISPAKQHAKQYKEQYKEQYNVPREFDPPTYKKQEEEKESTVQLENSSETEAIANAIVEHPLFVPIKTKAQAHTWFSQNHRAAKERLTYLNEQLNLVQAKFLFPLIAKEINLAAPEASMWIGKAPGSGITYNCGSLSVYCNFKGDEWKLFILRVLHEYGKDETASQVIACVERNLAMEIQSMLAKEKR